jgi:predicted lipoprotein with Yx(FWY)xxD motif
MARTSARLRAYPETEPFRDPSRRPDKSPTEPEEKQMPQPVAFRQPSPPIRTAGLAILAIAVAAMALAAGAAAQHGASKRVAAEADNATLGRTVLTTTKGRTLYSLSVEKNGKFICAGSCLSVWHPLLVPKGVKPTGPVRLATIARPEGGTQVTYKGRPLYRFGGDTKAGEANGEGIEDVGTWHAATAPQAAPKPTPQPQPAPENPYPY